MAPDLNSLPPSNSPPQHSPINSETQRNTPASPARSPSFSLAQAASINAGMQSDSRHSSHSSNRPNPTSPGARRRSNISMRIDLDDPALPGPGELVASDRRSPHAFQASPRPLGSPGATTADPHHQRTPSLGELHQELEQEQEAHVNRLLHMIRQQQVQLQNLQQPNSTTGQPSTSAIDTENPTPSSERSINFATLPLQQPTSARTRSPVGPHRASHELSRQNSYRSQRSSRDYSPSLRPLSSGFHGADEGRDESAFYQAEAQTLTRENQMLKVRIRELEKQVAEVRHSAPGEPSVHSHLADTAPSVVEANKT